jgi:hypothetical protein
MIITLCGSARFERLFKVWNEALTLAGHTVFDLAVYPSEKDGVKQWYTDLEKIKLDAAHLQKIAKSDAIVVLNLYGYIGESTLREIMFANASGKSIFFLESEGYTGTSCPDSDYTKSRVYNAAIDRVDLPVSQPIEVHIYGEAAEQLFYNLSDEDSRKYSELVSNAELRVR